MRQRRDAPCQTSVQNDPNDSWSEPDKQESARRMGLKSKIPVANNSNLAVADAAGENCVLDESDRMLDMGFFEDIMAIVSMGEQW